MNLLFYLISKFTKLFYFKILLNYLNIFPACHEFLKVLNQQLLVVHLLKVFFLDKLNLIINYLYQIYLFEFLQLL